MALSDIDKMTALHKNNEAQFLCFRLDKDGEIYAINVFKVQEIIKNNRQITLVEHDESRLLDGIFTFREKTVPLIDLRKWFHYDYQYPETNLGHFGIDPNDSQIMLCDFSGVTVGIRIYQADKILTKHWSDINPAIRTSTDKKKNKINNHTRYENGELVQIVDIEKMISEVFPFMEEELESEVMSLELAHHSKMVLVAEDSSTAQKMIDKTLAKIAVEYKIFENGGLLLDYIEALGDASNVGLIITDLEMPEVSGFEVIKKIRGNDKYAHIAIAVNSSMSGTSNRDMASDLGANAFISKTNPREISILINKYCK